MKIIIPATIQPHALELAGLGSSQYGQRFASTLTGFLQWLFLHGLEAITQFSLFGRLIIWFPVEGELQPILSFLLEKVLFWVCGDVANCTFEFFIFHQEHLFFDLNAKRPYESRVMRIS